MRAIILLAITVGIVSCRAPNDKVNPEDNPELLEIYRSDQADRSAATIDWLTVSKRDSLRQIRVYELLDSNKVRTSMDYQNAAMVFQHGRDSVAYGMAVKLMKKSVELNPEADKWLLAAAIDRDLLSRNKPQIYGTQYYIKQDGTWELRKIDTTKVTDADRIEYGVETLAQQRELVKQMNKLPLMKMLDLYESIDTLIQYIKSTDSHESPYDLSEYGLNALGYHLLSLDKDSQALKIFKLNTELFPDGANTYDSYGECLLKLGDTARAVIAYKKSLELYPDNYNAVQVLSALE